MSDRHLQSKLRRRMKAVLDWVKVNVSPGVRLLLGVLLIVAGIFGFLPILGFWMLPLGVAIAAMDIRPFANFLSGLRRK